MKVNSQNNISYKGFYNNKILKKGLEFASTDVALFSATATTVYALGARPLSILLAPCAEKEDKKVACAKSLASTFTQFLLTYLIATPIANSIEKIGNNPHKYLKKDTIKSFQKSGMPLIESKSYQFATQMLKLGAGAIVAVPKALLTVACLPFILEKVFDKNKKGGENINFKSRGSEKVAGNISKLLDKKGVQKFSDKYKDTNFVMHTIAGIDVLTTSTFIHQTYNSNKIKEERKKPLIYNAGISTALGIAFGYIADKLFDKPAEKFIEKYKKINKSDPNLEKQIRGIRIAKPILILGGVYYTIIPFISTTLAEFARRKSERKNLKPQ